MVVLLVAAALATAPPATWQRTSTALPGGWGLQARALGGVDAWTGGGGGALEVLASAQGEGRLAGLRLGGRYGGVVERIVDTSLPLLDAHAVELTLSGAGVGSGGAAIWARGGVAQRWAEAGGDLLVVRHRAAVSTFRLGALGRVSEDGAVPAVHAGAAAGGFADDALFVHASIDVVGLLDPRLPPVAADAAVELVHLALAPHELSLRFDARWVAPGKERIAVPGIGTADSFVVRAAGGVDLQIVRGVALHGQLDVEGGIGTVLYGRVRALAGVSTHAGRRSDRGASTQRAGRVVLLVRAPEAADVAVTGSFSEWHPQPMHRRPGGFWELPLPLGVGDYEYVYLVDGKPVVPPESIRQRPDGFGGQNGVLVVR